MTKSSATKRGKSAKDKRTKDEATGFGGDEQRHSPLFSQVVLLTGFAFIVVAAIFTVLVPELSSDDEAEPGAGAESAEAAEGDGDVTDAPAANDPAPSGAPPSN